jgi:Na+/H+ antiporter NhaD/arsenite permease-like protein
MPHNLPLLGAAPFALLLLSIALLPLIPKASAWWAREQSQLLACLLAAAAGALLYALPSGDWGRLWQSALQYAAFMALLGALYTISGGIHVQGGLSGRPGSNTLLLLIGALLANVLGTTGASMLLIRPLLRANQHRKHRAHVAIFFIFIVSNTAGLLTPLGDPPLYLGFLRGVPFAWTLRLLPEWLLVQGLLLAAFYLLDRHWAEAQARTLAPRPRLRIEGLMNLELLICVLALVAWLGTGLRALGLGPEAESLAEQGIQVLAFSALAWASFKATPPRIHAANHFSFTPLREVAILFFGIFGAMIPVLAMLSFAGAGHGGQRPWQAFWLSGGLSAFLDSAPANLAFATLAAAEKGLAASDLGALAQAAPQMLAAISCGAVLFGAATYIGNAPNLMVKAIAEERGVRMPGFAGFMLWSLAFLAPLLLLATLLFFI